jgi:gliding motility-associated-like protein
MNKLLLLVFAGCLFFPAGLASQSFFQHFFTYPGHSVRTNTVAQLADGRVAVGGQVINEFAGVEDAALLYFSAAGDFIWARRIDTTAQSMVHDLLAAQDGNILTVMTPQNGSGGISGIISWFPNGTIYWGKNLTAVNDFFTDVSELNNGFLLSGRSGSPQKGLIVKILADGQEAWRKTVDQPGSSMIFYDSWEDEQGFLYVVAEIDGKDGGLLKFNAVGDLVWARRLGTGGQAGLRSVIPLAGDKLLLGGTTRGADAYLKVWLTQTDLSGTVKWSSTYGQAGDDYVLHDLVAPGLSPVFSLSGTGAAPNLGAGLARVNDNGELLWIKNYDPPGQFSRMPHLAPGANNALVMAAALQTGSGSGFYVVRANANGDSPPCCIKSGDLTVVDIAIDNEVFVPNIGTIPPLTYNSSNWTNAVFSLQQTNLCNPASVEIALSDSVICPGECIDLTIVNPTPGVNYAWAYPGGKPQPGNPNRVCFPGVSSDVLITLFANDCAFQQDTALLRVDATEDRFPNAFTPNGDGDNDRFLPVLYCPVSLYTFRVFNRWGEIMFETTDPVQGWDGSFNGLDAPSDVYVWLMEYQGGQEEASGIIQKKGNVTLLR